MSVPLQVLGDGGAQEPEWLHCFYSAVHDGGWGECNGVLLKLQDHLHCFEHGDTCGTCCLLYGVSCHNRNLPLYKKDIGCLQNENNYDTIIQLKFNTLTPTKQH